VETKHNLIHNKLYLGYNRLQRDAINALKHSLISQFVKFFLLIIFLINQILQSICKILLTLLVLWLHPHPCRPPYYWVCISATREWQSFQGFWPEWTNSIYLYCALE